MAGVKESWAEAYRAFSGDASFAALGRRADGPVNPKGVQITANFPLAVHPYIHYGVDLRPDDVFWPTSATRSPTS
jgi:hypothetical protein